MNLNISGGVLGFLHLLACIWAVVNIVQSNTGNGAKVLWIAFVLLLPVFGLIVWFFFGPRGGRR